MQNGKVGRTAGYLGLRDTGRCDAVYPFFATSNGEFLDPPLGVGCKSLPTFTTVDLK